MKYLRIVRNGLIIASFVFLPLVAMAQPGGGDGVITNPTPSTGSSNFRPIENPLKNVTSLESFVKAILNNIILPIGSVIVVFFIIYSGFLFVTARGNESQLETAKHSLLYVAIGTAVLLGSVAISTAISGTVCEIAGTGALGICP